jgi:plasmid stabilization system protein ParE
MKVVYAQRARDDIANIYDSIAADNPTAAQRVEDMIRAACEGLAEFPYRFPAIDEINVRHVPLVRFPLHNLRPDRCRAWSCRGFPRHL